MNERKGDSRWSGRSRSYFRHPGQRIAVYLLIPTRFDDPGAARLVTVTVLLGLTAVGLAIRVYAHLGDEFLRERVRQIATPEEIVLAQWRASQWRAIGAEKRVSRGLTAPPPGLPLKGVDLRGAALAGVDLSGANLARARLDGADLSDADLTEADLRGARLTDTDLRSVNLENARYDRTTAWPPKFLPGQAGAVEVDLP
jgi:hypothetical protein